MKKTFFLVLVSLCGVSHNTFGQSNYYVSTSGSNFNDGSFLAPFEEVQFGIDQLSPGDTLNILEGEYHEKVVVSVSGTVSNRITIRNYANDEAILDGVGAGNAVPMLAITSKNYITIDGLTIRNNEMQDAQGILIDGGSDGITVQNCTFYHINYSTSPTTNVTETDNSQPLIVYGTLGSDAITNLQILHNEIRTCYTGFSEGLAINGNVDGFAVVGNSVHDLSNIGIDIIGHEGTSPNPATDQARNGVVKDNTVYLCFSEYATSAGIYVDGGKDLLIERNNTYDNGYGIEIGCENVGKTTDNIVVRNNLIYVNKVAGLVFGGYDYPSGSGKVTNCEVRNNTFFQNDFTSTYNGEMYLSYSENCSIHSNVFRINNRNTLAYAELSQPGLTMNHNLIYCPAGELGLEVSWNGMFYYGYEVFQTGTSYEANGTFGNPQFVTGGGSGLEEFHLAPSSPAIDAGNPTITVAVGETDFYGNTRQVGSRVDCGAVEFDPNAVSVAEELERIGHYDIVTQQLYLNQKLIGKEFQLISAEGKLVQNGSFQSSIQRFEHQPSGVYLLNVEGFATIKLLVIS